MTNFKLFLRGSRILCASKVSIWQAVQCSVVMVAPLSRTEEGV